MISEFVKNIEVINISQNEMTKMDDKFNTFKSYMSDSLAEKYRKDIISQQEKDIFDGYFVYTKIMNVDFDYYNNIPQLTNIINTFVPEDINTTVLVAFKKYKYSTLTSVTTSYNKFLKLSFTYRPLTRDENGNMSDIGFRVTEYQYL